MTPNERAIASTYIATFAARDDNYVWWAGDAATGRWVSAHAPLTPEVIWAAFAGGPSISAYTITPASTGHVACLDLDLPDGLAVARRLRGAFADRGLPAYVEPSRRGAHLWLVCDATLPVRTLRRALRAVLRDAGVAADPKIEFRPSHDEIKPDGFGSPIRMPTMPHPKTGRRYPLLDAADRPLPARLDAMLLAIDTADASLVRELADTMRPSPADLRAGDRKPFTGPTVEGSASEILRSQWGAIDARPNHSIRCPSHPDTHPSLSILADDRRAVCHSPTCDLFNDGKGRGTYELSHMAPVKAG